MSWHRKKLERSKYRDPNVIPARQRKAGPMDSNPVRGGSRSWKEFLDQPDEPYGSDLDSEKEEQK